MGFTNRQVHNPCVAQRIQSSGLRNQRSQVRILPRGPILEVAMRQLRHDDLTGETVAKVWHQIGGAISIAATLAGVGIALTSAAGIYWHRWAVKQHQVEIDRILSKESECPPQRKSAE